MVIAKDLAERKALLLARSDAVVVMAGGLGTLDEATEILEQRKHGLHDKPVVLLNTAGFYDGLIIQLRRMEDEGFLPVPVADLVYFADEGADALAYLEEVVGSPAESWTATHTVLRASARGAPQPDADADDRATKADDLL